MTVVLVSKQIQGAVVLGHTNFTAKNVKNNFKKNKTLLSSSPKQFTIFCSEDLVSESKTLHISFDPH